MIIEKKKAKEMSKLWGLGKLPAIGKGYVHMGVLFVEYLVNDYGTYKHYFEERYKTPRAVKGDMKRWV